MGLDLIKVCFFYKTGEECLFSHSNIVPLYTGRLLIDKLAENSVRKWVFYWLWVFLNPEKSFFLTFFQNPVSACDSCHPYGGFPKHWVLFAHCFQGLLVSDCWGDRAC